MQRLRAIPNGQISEVARRAEFPLTALLRLRRGESANIKLDSLEKLARGLQIPPAELIAGEPGDELPPPQNQGVDPRLVASFAKRTRAFALDVERFLTRAVPAEPPLPRERDDQPQRSKHGKR